MPFRVQGTHFIVTFPHADFAIDAGLEFFKAYTKGRASVVEVIICSEQHEDGSYHRHVYLRFNRRIDLRNPRDFDFMGKHGNVQRCNNPEATKNYIRKDGEYLEWSDNAPEQDNLFELAKTLGYEEFFERTRKSNISYQYARNAWDHGQSEFNQITLYEDPNLGLNLPLIEPLQVFTLSSDLTNVIVGPTGCGKTVTLCRRMEKPILFCTHVDQLKHFNPSIHRSILFDDMDFSHWPVTAQIHLCDRQMPRAINRRYGTTLIPGGVQVSVTCNQRPFLWDPAIQRRLNMLTLPSQTR